MKQIWDIEELSQYWSLNYEELQLLKTKPYKSHLAFCMQLKYYQYYGIFPESKKEFADIPLQYISEQLGFKNRKDKILSYYDWEDRTARRHRQEILDFLGIRKLIESDRKKIQDWLCKTVFPNGNTIKDSLEYVLEWLHQNKILRPAVFQIEKIIATSYSNFEKSLFENISSGLSDETKDIIDYCLEGKVDSISFTSLKSDPGRVSLDSVLKEVEKLEFINQLEFPEQYLTSLNSKIMSRLRSRTLSETAWELKRHPPSLRYVLMSVFFYSRRSEIIDGLVELLVQIIHRLSVKAEKKVTKTLMQDFRKVYGKDILLMRIAEAALNNPDSTVKEVVYPVAGVQILNNLVKEYKSSGKNYQKEVHKIIRSSYSSHYRRMVPKLLSCMRFCSNNIIYRPYSMP